MAKTRSRTHFEQIPLEKIAKLLRPGTIPAKKRVARVSNLVAPNQPSEQYSVHTAIRYSGTDSPGGRTQEAQAKEQWQVLCEQAAKEKILTVHEVG